MSGQNDSKGISLRQYAKNLNTTDTSVRRAIKSKKIVKGVFIGEDGKPHIIPEIANEEWGKNLNLEAGNNIHLAESLSEKGKKEAKIKEKPPTGPVTEEEIDSDVDVDDGDTYAEAKRKEAILKAKLLKLDLLEREKELGPRVDYNNQLMEIGIKFREIMQALPNQTIDNILAFPTRNEAVLYFQEIIDNALNKVSNVEIK